MNDKLILKIPALTENDVLFRKRKISEFFLLKFSRKVESNIEIIKPSHLDIVTIKKRWIS